MRLVLLLLALTATAEDLKNLPAPNPPAEMQLAYFELRDSMATAQQNYEAALKNLKDQFDKAAADLQAKIAQAVQPMRDFCDKQGRVLTQDASTRKLSCALPEAPTKKP